MCVDLRVVISVISHLQSFDWLGSFSQQGNSVQHVQQKAEEMWIWAVTHALKDSGLTDIFTTWDSDYLLKTSMTRGNILLSVPLYINSNSI